MYKKKNGENGAKSPEPPPPSAGSTQASLEQARPWLPSTGHWLQLSAASETLEASRLFLPLAFRPPPRLRECLGSPGSFSVQGLGQGNVPEYNRASKSLTKSRVSCVMELVRDGS